MASDGIKPIEPGQAITADRLNTYGAGIIRTASGDRLIGVEFIGGHLRVRWVGGPIIYGKGYFPVLVNQTGGANGTDTTKATYTYTVTDLAGNELGTAVALARPRENGAVTLASDPKYGSAFVAADGTLKLWDSGETYTTEECD